MRTRLVTVLVAAILAAVLFGACGPAGPHDDAGPEADPVALLTVLPVPAGLRDVSPATAAPAAAIMDAMLGESTPEGARRLTDSGMSKSAVRVFGTASGGRMYAIVSVWPSRLVASNFALEVAQRRLGKPGFRAWTPDDVPGTQGVRQSGGAQEKVVARSVGPNVIEVRSTGDVSEDAVARTLERLVIVQQAKG